MLEQLLLNVPLLDQANFDNYLDNSDGRLLQCLQALSSSTYEERFIYLWGAPGVGKTHLLQSVLQAVGSNDRHACYFDCTMLLSYPVELLEGIEAYDIVCLDNIEAIAGHLDWQKTLFNLYNHIRDTGQSALVISANCAATQLPLELADLKSRLAWGISFSLKPLNDEMKQVLLQQRAKERGINLSPAMADYILSRCGREQGRLVELLDHLDKVSLKEQRKITIPFIRKVLQEQGLK